MWWEEGESKVPNSSYSVWRRSFRRDGLLRDMARDFVGKHVDNLIAKNYVPLSAVPAEISGLAGRNYTLSGLWLFASRFLSSTLKEVLFLLGSTRHC